MWLMLPESFLSIVAHPKSRSRLVVRARVAGDIERVFPYARVRHTPKRDYAYRAIVSRSTVARALSRQVRDIDYDNFKDAVPDRDRHDAYLSVWHTMLRWAQGHFLPWPADPWPDEPWRDPWRDEEIQAGLPPEAPTR